MHTTISVLVILVSADTIIRAGLVLTLELGIGASREVLTLVYICVIKRYKAIEL